MGSTGEGSLTSGRGMGPASQTIAGEDDDVQMVSESVVIEEGGVTRAKGGEEKRGEEEEDEEEEGADGRDERRGISTPKSRGTRTPTGYTPEQKRNRLSPAGDQDGENEEEGSAAQSSLEGVAPRVHVGNQSSSAHPHHTTIPGMYTGVPVPPPPGIAQNFPSGGPSVNQETTLQIILQDLVGQMKTGFTQVDTRMQEIRTDLNRDLGKVRKEQRETKDIATKALTIADSTQKEVQSLSKRVEVLEKGGARASSGQAAGSYKPYPENLGFNSLGGEQGTDMVVGEFDQYASREERKANWNRIKSALPEWMLGEFVKEEAPGLRNRVMIISITPSPEGPEKTRERLVKICQDIRQAQLKYTDTEGVMRQVYANPTKPLALRQRNAQVTLKADALRKALGEEQGSRIELELGKSRVFLGKEIVAHRPSYDSEVVYLWPTVNKHLPEATPETMAALEEQVKAARAASNA